MSVGLDSMIMLQEDLVDYITRGGKDLRSESSEWPRLSRDIRKVVRHSLQDTDLADCAQRVDHNIMVYSDAIASLEKISSGVLDGWTTETKDILSRDKISHKTQYTSSSVTRKRKWGSHTISSPGPSSPSSSTFSDTSAPNQLPTRSGGPAVNNFAPPNPSDHLRIWFLNHLENPYPTAEEKRSLSELTGIPRTKIDSDMTNWRRRAGWNEIKDKFARGDKARMRDLIGKVQSGKEKRKVISDAVEGMKGYLERREEERVGDWVYSLTALAKERNKKSRLGGKVEMPNIPPPSSHNASASSLSAFGMNTML